MESCGVDIVTMTTMISLRGQLRGLLFWGSQTHRQCQSSVGAESGSYCLDLGNICKARQAIQSECGKSQAGFCLEHIDSR